MVRFPLVLAQCREPTFATVAERAHSVLLSRTPHRILMSKKLFSFEQEHMEVLLSPSGFYCTCNSFDTRSSVAALP